MLKPGLYEQIISQSLSRELASVSDACKHVEKLDAAEAPQALAGYVAEAVRAALEAMPAGTEEQSSQRIAGVYREDFYELPIDSIREMISNAVCHRSYVSPGSIQVAIYDDRLEVTSPGRISPDLTMEQLKAGNSRVRNVAIGAAFQYMHITEKWGTGIPRILKEAAEYGLREPELKDFGTSFRINIFRKPFETDPFGVVNPAAERIEGQKESLGDNVPQNVPQNDSQNVPQRTDRLADVIIAAINANPHVTRAEMASQAGVTTKTISRKLKDMPNVQHVGSSKTGRWEIVSQQPSAPQGENHDV